MMGKSGRGGSHSLLHTGGVLPVRFGGNYRLIRGKVVITVAGVIPYVAGVAAAIPNPAGAIPYLAAIVEEFSPLQAAGTLRRTRAGPYVTSKHSLLKGQESHHSNG